MQEDTLKDIFKNYEPELSSRMDFMNRLERNLDAVELIHKENAKAMKRNKLAVTVASATGLITGIVFSILMPYLNKLMSNIGHYFSTEAQFLNTFADYYQIILWLIIGTLSVVVSLCTYKIIQTNGINLLLSQGSMEED